MTLSRSVVHLMIEAIEVGEKAQEIWEDRYGQEVQDAAQ